MAKVPAKGRRAKAPGPSGSAPVAGARWRNRIVGYEEVDPRTLKPHEQNWRTHPGEQRVAMAGILDDVGVADAIKVSKRTGRILDGHLRHDLAIREGERTVPVLWLDVSEAEERKILATHDAVAGLAGIDQDNLDSLLSSITTDNAGMMALLDGLAETLDAGGDDEGGASIVEDGVELNDIADELDGAMQFRSDVIYPSHLKWGIPPLRAEMLSPIPPSIATWAGPDATADDGRSHYVYIWGSDSTRGLPFNRTILGFYTDDIRFDRFFINPAKFVAKVANAGIPIAIGPNYSTLHDTPKVMRLWAVYRKMFVCRYLQDAGIRIIPDVAWSDLDELAEFNLLGIPRNPPALAIQLQTLSLKGNQRAREVTRDGLSYIKETLEPGSWLVYGGPDAKALIDSVDLGVPVTFTPNRTAVRRDIMEGRRRNA